MPTPDDFEQRLQHAEAEIGRLRTELAAARAEARLIVEAIPPAISRRAALRSLVVDLVSPSAWWSGLRGLVARLRR